MSHPLNLKGRVFGRLKVVAFAGGARRWWLCVCKCGEEVRVAQPDLCSGDTTSCGCYKRELLSRRNKHNKVDVEKLSERHLEAYKKWSYMWRRVRHPVGKSACYAGVGVCNRWKSFYTFLKDMGPPPDKYSLERKNNSKSYSPRNCKWVPLAQQAQNTSRNRFVTVGGVRACVSEHAKRRGIPPDVVFDRINKLGWGVVRALCTPVRKRMTYPIAAFDS